MAYFECILWISSDVLNSFESTLLIRCPEDPNKNFRVRDILMDAIPIFDCAEQDYVISGCVIAQSNGQFLNIYDGLLDNSVPKAEEK